MRNTPKEFMTQEGHHNACAATSGPSSAVGTRSCACAALRQRQSRLREAGCSDLRGPSHENGFEPSAVVTGPRVACTEVHMLWPSLRRVTA